MSGGVAQQTEKVLKNLRAVLKAAGSDLGRAVKTVFLKSMNDFGAMNEVYGKPEYFGGAARPSRWRSWSKSGMSQRAMTYRLAVDPAFVLAFPDHRLRARAERRRAAGLVAVHPGAVSSRGGPCLRRWRAEPAAPMVSITASSTSVTGAFALVGVGCWCAAPRQAVAGVAIPARCSLAGRATVTAMHHAGRRHRPTMILAIAISPERGVSPTTAMTAVQAPIALLPA